MNIHATHGKIYSEHVSYIIINIYFTISGDTFLCGLVYSHNIISCMYLVCCKPIIMPILPGFVPEIISDIKPIDSVNETSKHLKKMLNILIKPFKHSILKELGHHINSKCTIYITIQVTAPTIL